jgi:hypothetical protein
MKRYLIKDTLVATEKNPNFAGESRTYWNGTNAITEDESNIKWIAKVDGYKTKAGAVKGLKKQQDLAEWETARGFWKHTSVEIIEVEVE